jgi:DNA-binding transcriptional ArsR family regulator
MPVPTRREDDSMPSIPKIDKLIHEPARLLIMAALFAVSRADFLFLKQQTGLTDGNLSSHASKLEEAGYLKIDKEFLGKKPHTVVHLTERGRAAFRVYQKSIGHVLDRPHA